MIWSAPAERSGDGAFQRHMIVQDTLRDLVSIDSVSSRSNAGMISYLEARCQRAGLKTDTYIHTDEAGQEKINMVAQTSSADDRPIELALVGHTDTVPSAPNCYE